MTFAEVIDRADILEERVRALIRTVESDPRLKPFEKSVFRCVAGLASRCGRNGFLVMSKKKVAEFSGHHEESVYRAARSLEKAGYFLTRPGPSGRRNTTGWIVPDLLGYREE
jgi:hypothetical protein